MRNLVGTLLLASALLLSGCLDGTEAQPDEGTEIPSSDAGAPLESLTFTDDGSFGAAVTEPDCAAGGGITQTHGWNIPSVSGAGIPWMIETVTVTVSKDDTMRDLDIYLLQGGEEVAAYTEVGPDTDDTLTLTTSGLPAKDLQILIHGCTSAMGGYSISATADMIATGEGA